MQPSPKALDLAKQVLRIESEAVLALTERLDDAFLSALSLILNSHGRVIVCGIGKSGHVGRKIAATLASTGTPAFFVHPAEASHGDLGMITADDVVIGISNSGESDELLNILPSIKRQGAKLIAMTGNLRSTLAQYADAYLNSFVVQEACPHNLAPTASTTAMLALGDALAVALLDARGFGAEDFARSHPGGSLGRRLLTHVRDVMRAGDAVPVIHAAAPLSEAIVSLSAGGLGFVAIVDADMRPQGIFTDGDLRRAFARGLELNGKRIGELMHPQPASIHPDRLAVEAVEIMEQKRINGLLVCADDGRLCGALNMHDLFAAKVI